MAVLKKNGEPRAPRRTKAEMLRDQPTLVTQTAMLDAAADYFREHLGCTKRVTPYRWVNPNEPATQGSLETAVFWENGAIKAESHNWRIAVFPNFSTNRPWVRLSGDGRKGRRAMDLANGLAELGKDLDVAVANEVARVVHTVGNGPTIVAREKTKLTKTDNTDDPYAGVKLELGVTKPPPKGRAKGVKKPKLPPPPF